MFAQHPLERQRYCPRCRRTVLAREAQFNALGHGFLCVLTCFLWLPLALIAVVWHGLTAGGYRCPRCGTRCRR